MPVRRGSKPEDSKREVVTGAEEQHREPKITQASDLVTFYANGARFVQSEYDLRIYFSEQVPPNPSDPSTQSTTIEKVCIIMSPFFAWGFYRLFDGLESSVWRDMAKDSGLGLEDKRPEG